MDKEAYQPLKLSQELRFDIRGVNYLVRTWGPDSAPPLVVLHGIRDTSHTFQFLVDALKGDWRIFAPDWRGHGQTFCAGHHWFHDYLADLDVLLDVLLPGQPVDLVGHSLGGNVAGVYAGLRPDKVRHLVSLDAFGILARSEAEFPKLLSSWLRSDRPSDAHKRYQSIEQMTQKLCSANPRLSRDKALYLARNLSRPLADGSLTWQFAYGRRRSMPTLHTLGEWIACWREITAPKLWIAAADPLPGSLRSDPTAFAFMRAHIEPESLIFLPDTGHNLHHDAPRPLAEVIERFLRGARVR
jgi:pimeloyl-ACP methyl ester carboxylesterase